MAKKTAAPARAPQAVDLLITGCDVVCIDAANTVVRDGAIAVRRNKIVWIGKARDAARRFRPSSRIDGSGQIAMPGMIDGHVHTAQQLLRGKLAEMAQRRQLKIPIWKNYYIPFEGMLEPRDVHLSGLVCYINMISVGTTCFAEAGGPHPDEMGKAALETGIRGFISLSTVDQGTAIPRSMMMTTQQAYDRNVALVKRWKGQDRVKAWLSLRQIMVCSPELIAALGEAARTLDTRIHTHLCEGTYEIDYALEHFGKRPTEFLTDLGVLSRRLHCAHSVLLSPLEMDLYVKHRPTACHCAFGNYAIGQHRLIEMWRRGIAIGLGTDGAAGWGSMDIFQVAHAARIGQQAVMGTPVHYRGIMSAEELLRVATNGGARSLGIEDEIGSLEAGKKADILLIDRSDMEHTPMYDPMFVLATTTVGRDVRSVIIDGQVVMKDRVFQTVDLDEVRRKLDERFPKIMERFEAATL
jgi:5-methylthioadenosine/S-adenosylhomocysteine deaminase